MKLSKWINIFTLTTAMFLIGIAMIVLCQSWWLIAIGIIFAGNGTLAWWFIYKIHFALKMFPVDSHWGT